MKKKCLPYTTQSAHCSPQAEWAGRSMPTVAVFSTSREGHPPSPETLPGDSQERAADVSKTICVSGNSVSAGVLDHTGVSDTTQMWSFTTASLVESSVQSECQSRVQQTSSVNKAHT